MTVDPAAAKGGTFTYLDQPYYFCNPRCREKFQAAPATYLPSTQPRPAAGAATLSSKEPDTDYTCPMHPEIVRPAPGACPICGMALEPRTTRASEEATSELDDMTRRFWVSLALSVPVFALGMSDIIPGEPVHRLFGARLMIWIECILATPVVVWGGRPFF